MKKPTCPTCKASLSPADYSRQCPACRSSKGKLAELHLAFGKNLGVNPKWRRLLREAAPLLVDYEGSTRADALVDWVADRIGGDRPEAQSTPIADVEAMVRAALREAPGSADSPKPADDEWTDYSAPGLWAKQAGPCSVDTLKRKIKRLGIKVDKLTSKQWRFHPADVPRLKEKPA